jgi:hypothetical protein
MFGIATGGQSQARLSDDIETSDPKIVLRRLRRVLKTHALTRSLSRYSAGMVLSTDNIIEALREVNPAAQHQQKTWKVYADRMALWLSAVGYLEPTGDHGWKWEDRGEESVSSDNVMRRYSTRQPQRYRENILFIGDTSPSATVAALFWLSSQPPQRWSEIEAAGHRNGARVLVNLGLIRNDHGRYVVSALKSTDLRDLIIAVWNAANKEPVLELVCQFLGENQRASGQQVGGMVAAKYERNWSLASLQRIGNSLRQWGFWLIAGRNSSNELPVPPGHSKVSSEEVNEQPTLF